jgi:hypothetical protein
MRQFGVDGLGRLRGCAGDSGWVHWDKLIWTDGLGSLGSVGGLG